MSITDNPNNYFKHIDVIKYNYKNSAARSSTLTLEFSNPEQNMVGIYYTGKRGKSKKIANILGIVFGTRATTFAHVKECKPWLCISIIRPDRTFDFQFNHYYELIWFLYHTNRHYHDTWHRMPMQIYKISQYNNIKKNETYVTYFYRLLDCLTLKEFEKIYQKLNSTEHHDCPICLDTKDNTVQLKTCKHIFCKECIDQLIVSSLKNNNQLKCPLCRQLLTISQPTIYI